MKGVGSFSRACPSQMSKLGKYPGFACVCISGILCYNLPNLVPRILQILNSKGTEMAVKFHCRKCGKRFVDWGAEKLAYKCPDCEDEELVRIGSTDDKAVKRPSLKRKPRRVAVATVPDEEEEVSAIDEEPGEDEGVFTDDEDEVEEDTDIVDESKTGDDVEETDEFEGVTPAVGEKEDDIEDTDEWTA